MHTATSNLAPQLIESPGHLKSDLKTFPVAMELAHFTSTPPPGRTHLCQSNAYWKPFRGMASRRPITPIIIIIIIIIRRSLRLCPVFLSTQSTYHLTKSGNSEMSAQSWNMVHVHMIRGYPTLHQISGLHH